jgi:hypothetical protein
MLELAQPIAGAMRFDGSDVGLVDGRLCKPRDHWTCGGEGGIRTHGTVTRTLDFESSPFGHSGTSPPRSLAGTSDEEQRRKSEAAPDLGSPLQLQVRASLDLAAARRRSGFRMCAVEGVLQRERQHEVAR